MATTEDAIVDRARDVCTGLSFLEATGFDFTKTPVTALNGAFVLRYEGDAPIGGLGFTEEARGTLEVAIVRPIGENYQTARRQLLQDARAVAAGIVRDGSESGEYAVEDAGRSIRIEAPVGAQQLIARVRVPLNFEAEL